MTALALRTTLALLVASPTAAAQRDSATAAFLTRARAATAKYHDRAAAIADGYRAMGPETPAMGQHWLQPSLLVADRLDPAAPPILEYATVEGRPVLVGVAFALPLADGESAPDTPVPASMWHAHGGTVSAEIVGSSHAGMGTQMGERVAVLHAWVWTPNPAGPFEAQNWALPFLRAGLPAPPGAPLAAAEALALGTGGVGFFAAECRARLRPDPSEAATLEAVLTAFADSVTQWRSHRPASVPLGREEVEWLDGLWARGRIAIAGALGRGGAAPSDALSSCAGDQPSP